MTDDSPSDYPEIDVPLTKVDMEHLEAGQPVFKAGDGTRLVLRFDGWQERNMVPVEALAELIQRWGERHNDEITMMEKAAWGTASRELHDVIEEYQ